MQVEMQQNRDSRLLREFRLTDLRRAVTFSKGGTDQKISCNMQHL